MGERSVGIGPVVCNLRNRARVWIDRQQVVCDDASVKCGNHIWGTIVVLTLAIIGVVAGWNVISNHQAKIEVRQRRIINIDADIASALEKAREVISKRMPDAVTQTLPAGTQVMDARVVSEVMAGKRRAFDLCYESVSEWNNQRQRTEAVIFDLLDHQSLYAVLTVACAVVGLYAAFALQRTS